MIALRLPFKGSRTKDWGLGLLATRASVSKGDSDTCPLDLELDLRALALSPDVETNQKEQVQGAKDHGWRCQRQAKNPKRSESAGSYERYCVATTYS